MEDWVELEGLGVVPAAPGSLPLPLPGHLQTNPPVSESRLGQQCEAWTGPRLERPCWARQRAYVGGPNPKFTSATENRFVRNAPRQDGSEIFSGLALGAPASEPTQTQASQTSSFSGTGGNEL